MAPYVAENQRPELVISGIGSTISTLTTVLWPLNVEASLSDEYESPAGPCESLMQEELRAVENAADEASRVTWPWHLLNLATGGLYTAIIGFGYHRWDSGVVAGASSFSIGELQFVTQPTRGRSQWDSYRKLEGIKSRQTPWHLL